MSACWGRGCLWNACVRLRYISSDPGHLVFKLQGDVAPDMRDVTVPQAEFEACFQTLRQQSGSLLVMTDC